MRNVPHNIPCYRVRRERKCNYQEIRCFGSLIPGISNLSKPGQSFKKFGVSEGEWDMGDNLHWLHRNDTEWRSTLGSQSGTPNSSSFPLQKSIILRNSQILWDWKTQENKKYLVFHLKRSLFLMKNWKSATVLVYIDSLSLLWHSVSTL